MVSVGEAIDHLVTQYCLGFRNDRFGELIGIEKVSGLGFGMKDGQRKIKRID